MRCTVPVYCVCATKTDQLLAEAPVDTVDELEAGIDESDILLPRYDREWFNNVSFRFQSVQ